jgi:trehalose 6-phosphate phosphatase
MDLSPFRGRTPVFVGDDVTDEDGIRAAEAVGGFGVKVGTAESLARFRVSDVKGVRDWLALGLPAKAQARTRHP